jgi:hypothetical protein
LEYKNYWFWWSCCRVQWETLVALAQVKSDNNDDDAVLPDVIISITSQPTALSGPVSAASANTITLTVGAEITDGSLDAWFVLSMAS